MSVTNGQDVTSVTWTPDSFRSLRDALKRPGLVTLSLWPEQPELKITLDLSGLGTLALTGKLINKVLVDKKTAVRDAGKKLEASNTDELDDVAVETYLDVTQRVLEHDDYILGAVIVDPKYYMMDELKQFPAGQPPDGLCVLDFTHEMRRAIIRVTELGDEELNKFRTDPVGYATALSEQGTGSEAESADASAGNAVVDSTEIRPSDMDEGEGKREGTPEGSERWPREKDTEPATVN